MIEGDARVWKYVLDGIFFFFFATFFASIYFTRMAR